VAEADRPLFDVTFAVLDVETTGGSPDADALTEVGAACWRSGELLGTFETFVDPGVPIPEAVCALTGITDDMVACAPSAAEAVAALTTFVGDAVVVGHNLRFDLAFVGAVAARSGWPAIDNLTVDTLALSRRLVRDDVPDCRLGTLARALRLEHLPMHRALADVLATGDLLHRLIELATGFGVLRLGDLLAFAAAPAPGGRRPRRRSETASAA
jgi:DNA polymerase III subunit epsilon